MDQVYNAIKGQDFIRHPRPLPPNPNGLGVEEYCAFHDGMGHHTMDCRSLWRQLQELVERGYLQEFILNPVQPLEVKVHKIFPEKTQPESQVIQCQEVDAIFGSSPIEGCTSRERAIYVGEA